MTDLLADLVTANHILAHEGVVDAFGHVSVRDPADPSRYYLSCSRSPELVKRDDLMHFTHDGKTVGPDDREPYIERFIHGAIYAARPDINAVIHSHAEDVLAFTISDRPLRPVVGAAAKIGRHIPVWDVDERFGNATDLLVRDAPLGEDLARKLGNGKSVLMRGHGFAAGAASLAEVVSIAIYLPINARVLKDALNMGSVKYLHDEEIASMSKRGGSPRAWEYWSQRAEGHGTPGT